MKKIICFVWLSTLFFLGYGQQATLSGTVSSESEALPFSTVFLEGTTIATTADERGNFNLSAPAGTYTLVAQTSGFRSQSQQLELTADTETQVNFVLQEDVLGLEEIVLSATRNRIPRKEAPVVVNIVSSKLLKATQSLSLADGLNFQPGVRVETNCQNCGFTQVRLNGLEGQYTQILVNNKPVFSALNGVYGLEQIPVSIIDRVEVVRSGGSALFGSNAIAGTINVITKEPVNNSWEVGSSLGFIDGSIPDSNTNVNASIVSEDLSSGVTFYGIYRNRGAFDANSDGFSEITKLTNTSVGAKAFLRPNDQSKLGLDFTGIREYRRGGDRLDLAPQFTDITEELDHNTIFTGVNYQWYTPDRKQQVDTYASVQYTDRDSYYGGLGGGRTKADSLLANNAFGKTKDLALVAGVKYTHIFKNQDVLTSGSEFQLSDTEDLIPGYNRLVDQRVSSTGLYAQYEWKPSKKFSALVGARLDHVEVDGLYTIQDISRRSEVSQTVLNPRFTLLYNITYALQFRGGYARGFRAPQAFNEDLHISSVGGEQQFVILSDDLESEFSNAFTGSLNYTKTFEKLQTNFLLEGFYTRLENPYTIVSTGASLPNGSILEESRNGSPAYVAGANIEFSLSPNPKWFFQAGATLQTAKYEEAQLLFEADGTTAGETDVSVTNFVRTPEAYGFLNANWTPNDTWKLDLTGSFTGPMTVPRVVSESGFINLQRSGTFFDLTPKATYHFDLSDVFHVELSGGMQNLFNSYQDDFQQGPLRDSDYIYGPNRPRTFFFGVKFGDF